MTVKQHLKQMYPVKPVVFDRIPANDLVATVYEFPNIGKTIRIREHDQIVRWCYV